MRIDHLNSATHLFCGEQTATPSSANAALPPPATLARVAARKATMSALLGMLAGLGRSGV